MQQWSIQVCFYDYALFFISSEQIVSFIPFQSSFVSFFPVTVIVVDKGLCINF